MIQIEEYILLSKIKRQAHLILDEACTERGGPIKGGLSAYCKGLMAHILDTSIPSGHKIHICHACNNAICSNPNHLYWGTAQENRLDQGPGNSPWQRMVKKYGYEEACNINARGKVGNTYGTGNKGQIKSEETRKKISLNHSGGRKKKDSADVAK